MYVIVWSDQGRQDLQDLHVFHRARVVSHVDRLRQGAELQTRNRKCLRTGVDIPAEYPDPTWELRVGDHRVLYAVEAGTVTVLRVRLKGRRNLGEIL